MNRSGVWAFRLDLEKDQEEEPEVTDQVEESVVPAYEDGPVVTCCDQSEYMCMCLCVIVSLP